MHLMIRCKFLVATNQTQSLCHGQATEIVPSPESVSTCLIKIRVKLKVVYVYIDDNVDRVDSQLKIIWI